MNEYVSWILLMVGIVMLMIAFACVVDTVCDIQHNSSEKISDDGEDNTHVIVPVPMGSGNSMYVCI